jgi:hypothetical protein
LGENIRVPYPKMRENRTFLGACSNWIWGRESRWGGEGEDESYTRHHVPKHYSVRLEKQISQNNNMVAGTLIIAD